MITTNSITTNSILEIAAADAETFNNVTDPLYSYLQNNLNERRLQTVTTTYTVQANRDYILTVSAGANYTITLPTTAGQTNALIFTRTDANHNIDVTLTAQSGQTIENIVTATNANTYILRAQEKLILFPSGTVWRVLDRVYRPLVNARIFCNSGSTYTVTAGGQTINYEVKAYDEANAFNLATDTFTVPVSGYWTFSTSIFNGRVSSGLNYMGRIDFVLNGSVGGIGGGIATSSVDAFGGLANITGTAKVNRNDTVNVRAVAAGNNFNVGNFGETQFQAHFIYG